MTDLLSRYLVLIPHPIGNSVQYLQGSIKVNSRIHGIPTTKDSLNQTKQVTILATSFVPT